MKIIKNTFILIISLPLLNCVSTQTDNNFYKEPDESANTFIIKGNIKWSTLPIEIYAITAIDLKQTKRSENIVAFGSHNINISFKSGESYGGYCNIKIDIYSKQKIRVSGELDNNPLFNKPKNLYVWIEDIDNSEKIGGKQKCSLFDSSSDNNYYTPMYRGGGKWY